MENKENIHKKILLYAICLLPPALVSGPFLPDLIVALSAIYFLIYLWKFNQIKFLINDFSKIFIVFYIYIVVRSFFAEDILLSLKNSFFYFRFLILVFLIKYLINHEKNFIRLFFYSLILTSLIISLDAIIEYIAGYHWLFDKSYYMEFQGGRISGLFDEEYILGSYLFRLYPVILTLGLLILDKKKILLLLLFTILTLFTIIISGERTSLASFFIIILLLTVSTNTIRSLKKKLYIIFGSMIFLLSIIFSSEFLANRLIFHTLNSFLSRSDFVENNYKDQINFKRSIEEHLGFSDIDYKKDVIIGSINTVSFIKEWNLKVPEPTNIEIEEALTIVQNKIDNKISLIKKVSVNIDKLIFILSRENKKLVFFSTEHHNHALIGIKMFRDNPIFGHGLKMFRIKCGKERYYLGARSCTTHPHNVILTFMSELGIVGLLFYLIGFFYIIKSLIIKSGDQKILLISFIVFLIPILPSGYFFNNYFSIIFYIGIGFYSGLKRINIDRNSL